MSGAPLPAAAAAAAAAVDPARVARPAEDYEFDVINSNPCMPAMLHAVDVALDRYKYRDFSTMPVWMRNLVSVMDSDKQHANVRLFVARLIRKYRSEMATPEANHALGLLAALSQTSQFSVGCYCEDERHCHRSVLRALLVDRGARLD